MSVQKVKATRKEASCANKKGASSVFNILKDRSLPQEAETSFAGVIRASPDNQQKVHIKRVFARGGFVVTEYVDMADGEDKFRMLSATEAAKRIAAITELGRRSGGAAADHDMLAALSRACLAARAQSDRGLNPILNDNIMSPEQLAQAEAEMLAEIKAARAADPALNEEMARAEAAAK
jgi:hypothetical protein